MSTLRKKEVSNIAKNIKEYRLRQQMTQLDFASLLEMNHQNYSKMERGVYTPSLDKLLEICEILYITPNDLLLEGREYDDYQKETFKHLEHSIVDIADTMKIVENLRVSALRAKNKNDLKMERIELDSIIQIFAWRNEHFWEIADFLYYKRLDELIKKVSSSTLEKLMPAKEKTEE